MTAYVFCDYKRQDEQTPINLTANITKQLLQHQDLLPETILRIYQRHHKEGTRPDLEEHLEMIGSLVTYWSRFCLVVDALDELASAAQTRQTLISVLHRLQNLHQCNLMIMSRYIPYLASELHQPLCVDIQASPDDIRRYVEGHIANLASCVRKNPELQETIAVAIKKTAEGM